MLILNLLLSLTLTILSSVNNKKKGSDQRAHPGSLISSLVFVLWKE